MPNYFGFLAYNIYNEESRTERESTKKNIFKQN